MLISLPCEVAVEARVPAAGEVDVEGGVGLRDEVDAEPEIRQAASGTSPRTMPAPSICSVPSNTAGGPWAPESACVT